MIASLLSLLLQAAAAQAGEDVVVKAPLPGTPQTPATMVVEPVAMMIATFDRDGDALVDRAELTAGVRASFDAIDTARTGKLRYLAFADWAQTYLGDRNALPSPFEVDRNSDDQITLDELEDHFSRLFARYDKDRSGTISRAELLTFRTMPVDAKGPVDANGPVDAKGRADDRRKKDGGRPPRR